MQFPGQFWTWKFYYTLVSLHYFTGGGTVKVVAGLGKLKPFKTMAKNVAHKKIFEK